MSGGHLQPQSFMRSLVVVNMPPLVKGLLALCQRPVELGAQQFRFEGAMKTFLLALGLRMVRPAMTDLDAQAHQPYGEPGKGVPLITPRRAIIHKHLPSQTV